VAEDGAGNVYVADMNNDEIRKITPAGVVTTLAGSAGQGGSSDGTGTAARFGSPNAVMVDSTGNVYVADSGNEEIREISPSGVVTTLAGSAGQTGSSDGTGTAARFDYPAGVAVDSAGNVYVADEFNDEIREITPSGVVSTLAGSAGQSGSSDGTGTAARFSFPTGVAVDSAGNICVADELNDEIRGIHNVSLATGDTAAFSETFDTKNIGTGKTLTAAGSVNDGNGGNNYTVTFATNATGQITSRSITVTAATSTKVYDGTTSSTATPTITGGSLVSGDTAAFTNTFTNKNAGTGKTLTAGGSVNDGNSGANYAVTVITNTTGSITPLAITVTAASITKVYDGTTSTTGLPEMPIITGGSLAPGDMPEFTETFDTKNVGTGKTLYAYGWINDGNGGENYMATFVTCTTGEITPKTGSVVAVASTKVYDGTTSSTAMPMITLFGFPTIIAGDTPDFTETFTTKNAGTGKTLVVSGSINDGNGGNNYSLGFFANTSGSISATPITVTAATSTKVYDGTTSSTATPTITGGSLATGDTAAFSETFNTPYTGTGETLAPAGSVNDGNGGNNYQVTFHANTTGEIFNGQLFWDGNSDWTTGPWLDSFGVSHTWVNGCDTVFPSGAGTITISNSQSVTADSVTFEGNGCTIQGGTLVLGLADTSIDVANSCAATIASTITGGGLTKIDSGTLTLTGQNSSAGQTTVAGGVLCITGSLAASAVTVASGATLSGTGTVGAVTVNGVLSPGVSGAGTLSTDSLDLAAGSQYNVDVTSTGCNEVIAAGPVTIAGASLDIASSREDLGSDAMTLIQNDGGSPIAGTFLNLPEGAEVFASPAYLVTYCYNTAAGQSGTGSDAALVSAPLPPSTLTANAVSDSEIDLSWTDANTTAAGYLIQRSTDDATWTSIGSVAGGQTSFADTSLAEGDACYYQVVAQIGSYESGPSETTYAVTLPTAPTGLTANIVDGSEVDLAWTNNSAVETGYSIQQLMPDGVTWQEVQTVGPGTGLGTMTVAVSGVFEPSTSYSFRVEAYGEASDACGEESAVYSNPSNAPTVTALDWPMAPTNLTATAVSNSEVDVSWTDNDPSATSYEVDWSADGQTWTTLATLSPGATSYDDTGLTDGTEYDYRVQAANAAGGSGYALITAATLPTAPANLTASAVSGTEIDLSWDAARDANGYNIFVNQEQSALWLPLGAVPASQTTFKVTGLQPGGTEYSFYVMPTNSSSPKAIAYLGSIATIDQAPTVATAPWAAQNPVTGTSVALSVLGNDDGGESNLTYSWIASGPYNGGAYFSVNDSNAAKNTTVTFYAAGTYTCNVLITDALGLYVDASVDVTVQQTLTHVEVSRDIAVEPGGSVDLVATALDQFGNGMMPQPSFSWSPPSGGTLVPISNDNAVATYTAPTDGGGYSVQISASAGGYSGSACVAISSASDKLLDLSVADDAAYTTNIATSISNGDVQDLIVAGTPDPTPTDPTAMWASVSFSARVTYGTNLSDVDLAISTSAGGFEQGIWTGNLGEAGAPTGETLNAVDSGQSFSIVVSAGGETREVDVEVVTPWTDEGRWTQGHAALVKANADAASLDALALDITGNPADASYLGCVGPGERSRSGVGSDRAAEDDGETAGEGMPSGA
jgi:hypothetical protein